MAPALRALLAAAAAAVAGASINARCYALVSSRASGLQPPVVCQATAPRDVDLCFLMCGLCSHSELSFSVDDGFYASYCTGAAPLPPSPAIVAAAASTLINASSMQGTFWIEDNVTDAFSVLVAGMPRRDMMALFAEPFSVLDFFTEHVRYALNTWAWASSLQPPVPWPIFLNNVIPYAFLDEKRDFQWRWRPRFYELLAPLVAAPNITTVTQAMAVIVNALPLAQTLGVYSLAGATAGAPPTLVPGQPITWRSETSPGYLSPSQVAYRGGSCTGTGIVLAAAARSVGIPARLAGCSQSIPNDDHHWVEFWDGSNPGFAGDFWHTKEGVSAGNAGGPWDGPSGPMLGCLAYVIPGDSINTLWASSWTSATYLPALWSNDTWSQAWSFAGGENRCGAYCTAWGCGTNNTQKWSQAQCGPTSAA